MDKTHTLIVQPILEPKEWQGRETIPKSFSTWTRGHSWPE